MATPTFSKIVASSSYGTTSTRTLAVISTGSVPSGGLVVVAIATESSATISRVYDSASNADYIVYQQAPGTTSSPGYAALAYLRLTNPLTSSDTITVEFSGTCTAGIAALAFTDLSDQRVGQNSTRITSSTTQSISVTPESGKSGYIISLISTWAAYDRGTTALSGTTRLLGINPSGVTTWNPDTLNLTYAMQYEVIWKSTEISSSSSVGVDIGAGTIGYHSVAVVLPEYQITDFAQIIEMF